MTQDPGFDLRDVWLKYRVRYHRPPSLRGMVTAGPLKALVKGYRALRNARSARRKSEAFWALRGITLSAGPGEVVGIIGSNGAGKSSLLHVLAGIVRPDRGTRTVSGTLGTLLSFGAGFNPLLTGRENVFFNGGILGLTPALIRERLQAIVELADIGDFFDAPVSTYSSGMRARLGFAVAVHIDPDVLLIDEVVQVGDAFFQRKAGTVFDQLRLQHKVIALVSHGPNIVQRYCTRAVWMEQGQVRRDGPPEEVLADYLAWAEARAEAAQAHPRPAPA